nr:uncharacterized protein LOC111425003 [Onthophagus taurus]
MRCFVIVLIIDLYLCNSGGYGKELPWEGRQNRKLLLLGGAPVTDKTKSVFSVSSDKGPMTAVVFRDQLIALPGIVANPKVGGTALERKSSNGGWTFWSYKDAVEPIGDHYTGDAAPSGTCEIVGSKNNVSVKISSAKDDAYNVEATSGKICHAELGAPMKCDGKLVGLVHHLLPNGTQNKTEEIEEEATTVEEETKETFPGTDKPEDEETPPPKDRKKRDDDENDAANEEVKEEDKDEKKDDKKADKKDKKDKKSSGECSILCEVTPIAKITDKPAEVKERKNIRARSGGVMTKIIKIDTLLILLFSSLILLI